MQIRFSAHGAYHHQYHILWIPKYRQRILKGEVKQFLVERLFDIQDYHPDIEIEKYRIQEDHIHRVIIIPPRYSVSGIVAKLKANTSREIRKRFAGVRKLYWRNEFWSMGFFSSTVGINEEIIKRYVDLQDQVDRGQMQLRLDWEVPRA